MKDVLKPGSARTGVLDSLAVILSGTCMVHCFALPVLLTLYPIAQGSLLQEDRFHQIMLFLILPTSLMALTVGCRKHKDLPTVLLGSAGLLILTLTALQGHVFLGADGERAVTSLGGLILAGAHLRNYLCCREVNCQHGHCHVQRG